MAVPIPATHKDLLERPVVVGLITIMPDGQPQATPVWINFDGTYLIVNTARGRQKDKNMKPGAKVTVLAIDPEDAGRWIEIRGQIADESEVGAVDVINALSVKYGGSADFFGDSPRRFTEQRVTYKIEPTKVNTSG